MVVTYVALGPVPPTQNAIHSYNMSSQLHSLVQYSRDTQYFCCNVNILDCGSTVYPGVVCTLIRSDNITLTAENQT
jgi:hypothetical protein